MNILCVIESGTWAEPHLAGSLRASGNVVRVFHYGPSVGEFYGKARRDERTKKNRDLLATAIAMGTGPGLDLIFCYVYDDFLEEETAAALARLGVPLVNYNVDMVNQWYRQTLTASHFTMMLCAQRTNMDQLARYNPRVMYFPMAGNSGGSADGVAPLFAPAAPVTFLGTPMPHRDRVLSRLCRHGVPLAVYGKFWKEGLQASAPATLEKIVHDVRNYFIPKVRAEGASGLLEALGRRARLTAKIRENGIPQSVLHGFLPDELLPPLFCRSAINLGFTRISGDDPDKPGVTQLKLRDFEVPMAGGFYLVERSAEYEALFRRGVEMETWETPDELIDKIGYYLSHEEERRKIAMAGKHRAAREHTWDRRFRALFAELGLKA